MSKEKEMKQHLQQYDKDTLIELYLQKDFDTKQQLAEKDKEIENLRQSISVLSQNIVSVSVDDVNFIHELENQIVELRSQLKEQRHQICEEIREKLNEKERILQWQIFHGETTCAKKTMAEILDQIEKGE